MNTNLRRSALRPIALGLLALIFSAILLGRAQAGGGRFYPPVTDAVVRECGGYHLAYPAACCRKSSWSRIMSDLRTG